MRKLIVIISAVVLLGAARVRADQTSAAPSQNTPTYGTPQNVELTGSRLKTTYRRWDRVQDSPFNLYVIDRRAIERSGATTVAALLRYYGAH